MASSQHHRKQLAKYLSDKQKPATTRTPSKTKALIGIPPRKGKTTIYDLPNEIIMKIFEYLSMGDLLTVAQVCHLWHQLSSDNLLWKPLLEKSVPSQALAGNQIPQDLKTANLKSSFMQRCIEMRNKRILRLLKKKNPYTRVIHSKDVESAIKYAGISWQIVFTDTSGNEHSYQQQDVTFHLMSVSVRWFSLIMLPVNNIKKISVYSCNPLFFDNSTGKAISNGPYQRSLVYCMDMKLSTMIDKLKPVGSEENLKIYTLEDGITLGIWKDGGEIAMVAISNSLPGLVKRCIMGSVHEMYREEKAPCTMSESSYGLYGYSCTVQLRTMKQEIWDQQFTNVECPNSNISSGFAQFHLIKDHERQLLQKDLVFPWKTDVFRGKIKDVCCLDIILTNNEDAVVWFCSTTVNVKRDGSRRFTSEMDFNYCREQTKCIEFTDHKGKVFIQIDKDEECTYITHISLKVSMDAIKGKEQKNQATDPNSDRTLTISGRPLSQKSYVQ